MAKPSHLAALPTPADPGVVELLEQALERARAGDIQHIAFVELNPRLEARTNRVCDRYAAMVLVGAIEGLKARLVAHMNDEP